MTEWHQSSIKKKIKEQQPFEDGINTLTQGLPKWCSGKNICLPIQETQETWVRSPGSISGLGRSPGEGNGNPLHYPENSIQRSLKDNSPWGHKESDITKQLSFQDPSLCRYFWMPCMAQMTRSSKFWTIQIRSRSPTYALSWEGSYFKRSQL